MDIKKLKIIEELHLRDAPHLIEAFLNKAVSTSKYTHFVEYGGYIYRLGAVALADIRNHNWLISKYKYRLKNLPKDI